MCTCLLMLSAVCGSARLYSASGEEKGAARTELATRKKVARRDVDNMSSGQGGQAGKDAETKEESSSRKSGQRWRGITGRRPNVATFAVIRVESNIFRSAC